MVRPESAFQLAGNGKRRSLVVKQLPDPLAGTLNRGGNIHEIASRLLTVPEVRADPKGSNSAGCGHGVLLERSRTTSGAEDTTSRAISVMICWMSGAGRVTLTMFSSPAVRDPVRSVRHRD
jgi:hypothetical protein